AAAGAGSVAGAGAAGAAAGAALGDGRADPPSTQAVPVVDPARSIPHAAERPPEPWPGQNARSRPAGPEPHRDPADRRPAQPRQARGRPHARRRPARRSMWLGWLLVVPLLAALGWLVWTIAQGLDDPGGTDPTSVTQPTDA